MERYPLVEGRTLHITYVHVGKILNNLEILLYDAGRFRGLTPELPIGITPLTSDQVLETTFI